jgi:cytochrome c551/c552
MRKIVIYILLANFVISITTHCTNNSVKTDIKKEENSVSKDSAISKGEYLVLKDNCSTCHKPDNKFQGPYYIEIADKYAADTSNISLLANSIIKGSKGKWGEIPMTAHTNLTQQEAEAMVKYIFYFKKYIIIPLNKAKTISIKQSFVT